MRYYENLFILEPRVEGDRFTALLDSIKKELVNLGGTVLKVDEWGKKRLSYPINHQKYGNYILMNFETEDSDFLKEYKEWMKINEDVLANMIVRLDGKPNLDEKFDVED